jgi:hypothetical protein
MNAVAAAAGVVAAPAAAAGSAAAGAVAAHAVVWVAADVPVADGSAAAAEVLLTTGSDDQAADYSAGEAARTPVLKQIPAAVAAVAGRVSLLTPVQLRAMAALLLMDEIPVVQLHVDAAS